MNKRLLPLVLLLVLAMPAGIAQADAGFEPAPVPPMSAFYVNGTGVAVDDMGQYGLHGEPGAAYIITADQPVAGNISLHDGGLWFLASDVEVTGQLTVLDSCALQTAGFGLTCGSIYIGEYGDTTAVMLDLGASTVRCFAFAIRGDNVTLQAGTSTIITTLLFDDSTRTGHSYYNVTITSTDTAMGFIEGESSFQKLTVDAPAGMYVADDLTTEAIDKKAGVMKAAKTAKKPKNKVKVTVKKSPGDSLDLDSEGSGEQ